MDNQKQANTITSAPLGLSGRLRQELRHLHDMVERNGRLASLVSPTLSPEQYVAVLARLYGFYRPLEQALSENQRWLPPELRSEPRWPRLQADLAWWGISHEQLTLAPASLLPAMHSAGAVTGIAYVLEGASLGGRIIANHVERALGLSAPDGMSFHVGSHRKASHWQQVRDALDHVPVELHEVVLDGASSTYRTLNDWM